MGAWRRPRRRFSIAVRAWPDVCDHGDGAAGLGPLAVLKARYAGDRTRMVGVGAK